MFLFEKYKPKNIHDFLFNRSIVEQLIYIAQNEDTPHIIIAGPSGGGKKTLARFYMEALYDSDVHNLTKIKYNVSGSSTKKEIEIMQSNYHIIIEPTSTNHDKYILQEIIKQYAKHKAFNIFKTNRKFKTIVINNIENLAMNSQAALRRTMELYAKSCRFVMICNNLSKVFEPLRSRCRIFRIQLPSIEQIDDVITNIGFMENMDLLANDKKYILDHCNNNLKKAIWILDAKRIGAKELITLEEAFDVVVDNIINIHTAKNIIKIFDDVIRADIYDILITNIKGSEIITTIMDRLIDRIDNDEICLKIIQYASDAEYNLVHGRRDIIHIDYFISGVMKEILNYHLNKIPVPVKKTSGGSKTVKIIKPSKNKNIKKNAINNL